MNAKIFLLPALFFILLYACEFPLIDSVFSSPDPQVISLELSEESDTIAVYTDTKIKYNLDGNDLDIKSVKFSLEDSYWEFYTPADSFTIKYSKFTPGFHILNLEITTNSPGSGILNLSGDKSYTVTRTWVIRIGGESAPELKMHNCITDDGYLRIGWDKCVLPNFVHYEIIFPDYSRHYISDRDSTFIIDSNYVCGTKDYQLICTVNGNELNQSGSALTVSEAIPQIFYEEKGLDSLRLFWNLPRYHNCLFYLYSDHDTFLSGSADTTITLEHPGLSKTNYYLYTVHSKDSNSSYGGQANSNFPVQQLPGFGYYNDLLTDYSITDNVLYAVCKDSLVAFNHLNKRLGAVRLGDYNTNIYPWISCSAGSEGVCALFDDRLLVFKDHSLNDHHEIKFTYAYNRVVYGGDRIIVTGPDSIMIISAQTYEPVLLDKLPVSGFVKVSGDGRYVVVQNRDFIISMYEVKDGLLEPKFSYYSFGSENIPIIFDDADPSRFFIKEYLSNSIEMRKCEDNSVISSIDLYNSLQTRGAITLYNTDPFTGYLFISYGAEYYILLDMDEVEIKLMVPRDYYKRANLYNYNIYTEDKFILDTEKYLL